MRKQFLPAVSAAVLAVAVFSCQKAQLTPEATDVAHSAARTSALSTPGSANLGATLTSAPFAFEAGALTRQGLAPGAAETTTLTWYRDNVRLYLKRDDTGENLAGVATNNGLSDPNRIIAFKGPRTNDQPAGIWAHTVPIVLLRKFHGRSFVPALATPVFRFGYPNQFAQSRFEPVGADGTVTVGDFTAKQGDGSIAQRVVITKTGVSGNYARTNGAGENGTLIGLTVLSVRTGATLVNGKLENVYEEVPFVLIQHPSKGLTLQTRIAPGGIRLMSPIAERLTF
jgi:hypothetical protein